MTVKASLFELPRTRLLIFILILLLVAAARIYFVSIPIWPITGDETQYWLWAQHLDWGYFSKPPILAWLIAISNDFFGQSPLGLRIFSPILHLLTSLVIYIIGQRFFDERTGFWAGLGYYLSPGVLFASQLISTDTPLLFFSSLSLYFFMRAVENPLLIRHCEQPSCLLPGKLHLINWICLGIFTGLALLSKYIAIFLPIGILLFLIFQRQYWSKNYISSFLLTILIAFVVVLPNIIWNAHHHFVSFQAVQDSADYQGLHFHWKNFLNFFFSQFAIFNPILFIGLLFCFFDWKAIRNNTYYCLLLAFILPIFVVMLIQSLISQAHANWAALMYIPSAILVSNYFLKIDKEKLLFYAFALNIAVMGLFFEINPIIHFFKIKLPTETTQTDWTLFQESLTTIRQHFPNAKILVNDRMLFANTAYFAHIPTKNMLKWNPQGTIEDQFDMNHSLKEPDISDEYLLVSYPNDPQDILTHFKTAKSVAHLRIPTLDGRGISVSIYYLTGFYGYNMIKN